VTPLDFYKMQLGGNDFVVVLADDAARDWQEAARWLCRRRFSIGSDGLVVVTRGSGGCYGVLFFNPDGSPDTCGNGALCAAWLLLDRGLVNARDFALDLRGAIRSVRVLGLPGGGQGLWVDLGPVVYDPPGIPALFPGDSAIARSLMVDGREFTLSSVSTGSPHAVLFADSLPDDDEFFGWTPRLECHRVFPENTSVIWAAVRSADEVAVRIWERGGVGESLSCGTGACAVAAVAHKLGLTGRRIKVVSSGGESFVEFDADNSVWLGGRPQIVFSGTVACGL